MRILLCVDSLGIGGKERQAVELAKGLAAVEGMDCRVICFDTADFYLPDLKAVGIPVDHVPRRARWDLGIFERLRRLIKLYKPDVIHTNGLVSSFYSLPFARLWRIPLVNGSIRNAFTEDGFRWTVEKTLLKLSDFRVANSCAGLGSRNLPKDDPKNIVVYNGFDFARVDQLNQEQEFPRLVCDSGRKIVGMVAEFNRYKDHRTFVEAARIFSRTRPQDAAFVTVGAGDTLTECERAADGIGIQFLGQRKNVERLVGTFDIGVLCTFGEGLSNSIMEYMALGKPVVATDCGGTRELVVDGQTGVLVKQSDPRELAEGIGYLIDHPDVAVRMGHAGQLRLRREFPLTRMIDDTLALYVKAAGSKGARNDRVHSGKQ